MPNFDPSIPYEEHKSKLLEANDSYYNKSFSIMTDVEYDILKDEFIRNYPDDPFILTIGAPVPENTKWEKVKHKIPMLSCNKVNLVEEFVDWVKDHNLTEDLVIAEKLDGCSVSIDYEDGKLIRATTRGDGEEGESITPNVLRMRNVKEILPVKFTGTLRGEIMMRHEDLKAINFICNKRDENEFQNVRNGASGIARRYDGKYVEYLYIEYYYVTGDFKTQKEYYEFIENILGLKACKHYFGNVETVKLVYNEYEENLRAGLDHDIDGLVISPNNLSILTILGKKGGNLRGQIAWKFNTEKVKTKVKDVVWQLGNSSRITPVVIMEPVWLMGSTVKRASVHNFEMFQNLNLHKDDIVLIEKANDIIPQIIKNLSNNPGSERGEKLKVISNCPACGEPTVVDGVFLVCDNSECSGGKIGDLKKWVKKLDLNGIAGATLERLFEADLVETPDDLYKLKPEVICELEGFGSRSANKIIETLNSKKEVTFKEFIAGLNISNFSGETAELLEENGYDTVDKILSSNENDLVSIKGIGLITAKEIIKGLKKKVKVIEKLYNVGIKIKPKESKTKMSTNSILNGESYCFTGAIQKIDENGERFTREKMWSLVEENGGIVSKSITKEVTYLVTADPDSNSSKIQKARKSGINIISEDEFFKKVCL